MSFMIKRNGRKKRSIQQMLLIPMMAINLLVAAIFLAAIVLRLHIAASFLLALLLGFVLSLIAVKRFVVPIRHLRNELAAADADDVIRPAKTGIDEIDMLIDSIEFLSADLLETGRRTIQAFELTGMPIGFFEIDPTKKTVFLSDFLFDVFSIENDGTNRISLERWDKLYDMIAAHRLPTGENHYFPELGKGGQPMWLRIRTAARRERVFGIAIDITQEMHEKKRLEFERDTDALTGLLNRGAFFNLSRDLIRGDPDKLGVMLFADLDNLKQINDTYGHDIGDRYICAAAAMFAELNSHGAAVARISGDEFAMFLYGFSVKEQIDRIIVESYHSFENSYIVLPDGQEQRILCSIGFSWYPNDSDNLEVLLKYADFAMYETKRRLKGSMSEFNIELYLRSSYSLERNESFSRLLEQNLVMFAFQPIVDVFTGDVFAYEALMRPQVSELRDPIQVLELAKSQSKLYQVERMTLFNVFEWIKNNCDVIGSRKIFFNSIDSQILSDKDYAELESEYGRFFSMTLTEITQAEVAEEDLLYKKTSIIRRLCSGIAIDNLHGGDISRLANLKEKPDFLKIGIKYVRGVYADPEKSKAIEEIIGAAHSFGIKIICEGVEQAEEAEELVRLGADYLQGYYLARPAYALLEIDEEVKQSLRRYAVLYRDRRKNH